MLKKSILSLILVVLMIVSIPMAALADGAKDPEKSKDYGPEPYTVDLAELAKMNTNFRDAVWTGDLLQLVVMCLKPQEEIGVEQHEDTDHFFYVVEGTGIIQMGKEDTNLNYEKPITAGSGIFVPKAEWHNIINTGSKPLKILVLYAPPHHERGVVDTTKAEAEH